MSCVSPSSARGQTPLLSMGSPMNSFGVSSSGGGIGTSSTPASVSVPLHVRSVKLSPQKRKRVQRQRPKPSHLELVVVSAIIVDVSAIFVVLFLARHTLLAPQPSSFLSSPYFPLMLLLLVALAGLVVMAVYVRRTRRLMFSKLASLSVATTLDGGVPNDAMSRARSFETDSVATDCSDATFSISRASARCRPSAGGPMSDSMSNQGGGGSRRMLSPPTSLYRLGSNERPVVVMIPTSPLHHPPPPPPPLPNGGSPRCAKPLFAKPTDPGSDGSAETAAQNSSSFTSATGHLE